MSADIEQTVKDIIVEQLGVDAGEVKPEASFVNDLGADSLDTVELVMALEEAFDMEIPDEEAEKIQTVGQAIEYIQNNNCICPGIFFRSTSKSCRYSFIDNLYLFIGVKQSIKIPIRF